MLSDKAGPVLESLELRVCASVAAITTPPPGWTNITPDVSSTRLTRTPFGVSLLERPAIALPPGVNAKLTPYVVAYVDDSRTLNVVGTFADDSLQIRVLSRGLVRIDTGTTALTFDVYARSRAGRHAGAWSSTNTFDFKLTDFDRVEIQGGDGDDTARIDGLPLNTVTNAFETAVVVQHEAAAGETPSDPIHNGRFRPRSYWAKLVKGQQAAADSSRSAVAFFGDSHAALFPTVGHTVWSNQFPRALNLGISGDGTRQLLTRIEDGLFDKFKPSTLLVSVGANNFNDPTTGGTNKQIVEGILAVMDALRDRLPKTKLVLMGLLPRAATGLDDRVKAVNARVIAAAGDHGFLFLDVHDRFAGKPINTQLLNLSSHFTPKGYKVLAAMLVDLLHDA